MQFEDTKVGQFMWTKFNEMILKHGFPKPNFKGFIVHNTQANWNVVVNHTDTTVCGSLNV